MIDFANLQTSREDTMTIHKIAQRAVGLFGPPMDQLDWTMSIEACHNLACPLRLADLLAADDANFGHDVVEINRHLNRETGELMNCFVPRYAVELSY